MSKDALSTQSTSLKARGMDDTLPISPLPTWYNTSGIIEDLSTIKRMSGKSLLQRCNSAVVAIHAGLRGIVLVQTETELVMFNGTILEPFEF